MSYNIREAAKISGLPESTLRYYENIGLIDPIKRDDSSKYRIYSDDDVNLIVAIACLNATGLSIEDMRQYLKNREAGPEAAKEQIGLLKNKKKHLEGEVHFMRLRLQYLESKIEFWKAVESGDKKRLEKSRAATYAIADEMKLPKALDRKD
jgi:DNA-binding transcriptional MerR regulator